MSDPVLRRAALIATAVTIPFIVIAAFVINGITGGTPTTPSPSATAGPVTAAAPPLAQQQTANCAKVLAKLPVSLDGLPPRVVHTTPDTPFVVAWGNPAVVLRCGVAKPAQLHPGSAVQYRVINDLAFVLGLGKKAAIYTSVDRAPCVSVDFPAGVQPATYLPTVAAAIKAALPAVCSTDSTIADPDKLCTRRS
ncbi:DUF3515 family protein [uncultured Jatrophihabitans sp.]|uniref:DUF3515 family protein n=1 Tax=uncultured Jatrophihabitans sp. TaxID=1610747 RepID=UPI0035CAF3A0